MTDAPNTSTYLLYTQDTADLPNSRVLTASTGLNLSDGGPSGSLFLSATGHLQSASQLSSTGYVTFNPTTQQFSSQILQSSSSLSITNPDGLGVSIFSVIPNTTVQQINVQNTGTTQATRSTLNFIAGPNTTITVVDNVFDDSTDVRIVAGTSNAPGTASYILQTPDALNLPDSFALSGLSTGILKNTTATGVPTIAVAGTDYQAPSSILTSIAAITPTAGTLLQGNGSGYSGLSVGAVGTALISNGTTASWGILPGTGTVTSVGITSALGSLSIGGAGPNPITASGTINIDLPIRGGITPGVYPFASLTVDGYGLITAISSGTPGTVTSVDIASPLGTLSTGGGTITGTGTFTVDLLATGVVADTYSNANLTLDSYGRVTFAEDGIGSFVTWTNIDPTPAVTMAAGGGYITLSQVSAVAFTVPALPAVGDSYIMSASTSSNNGFTCAVTGPQIIYFNAGSGTRLTSTSSSGASTSLCLVCIDNTTPGSEVFQVLWTTGTFVVA